MVKALRYVSGDEVERGDQVRYHGELGKVEFVVCERTGDLETDWYLDEYSSGGFMISAEGFGRVFLTPGDIDEHLEVVKKTNTRDEAPIE